MFRDDGTGLGILVLKAKQDITLEDLQKAQYSFYLPTGIPSFDRQFKGNSFQKVLDKSAVVVVVTVSVREIWSGTSVPL